MSHATLTQVVPLNTNATQRGLGYLAAAGTVLIWSVYFLSLRLGALSPLGSLDITLFRYAVPGLVLLPLLVVRRARIRAVSPLWLLGMVLGAGLPFFLLSVLGMGLAPVVQGSTLIPGTAPLFVSLLAAWVFGQRVPPWRRLGLATVLAGVLCLLGQGMGAGGKLGLGLGQGLFLLCSLLWALFTLCVRQSGLRPLEVAAIVTVPNGALVVAWLLLSQTPLTLGLVPVQEWLTQLLVQGLVVGLGASFLFGYAISRLGAEISAAVGSLTPVCATLLAWCWLGEQIAPMTGLGLLLVTLGVIGASGLVRREARA
ncbi:DMT family transporter [Zobellella sp. DQSA1]|uniref:DMT family transporter n=1 Tax=Zobellella sp. DQSA1 TaxID=3342386 RepID=UPI0035BF7737